MEINLNAQEISAILVSWAKQKYKTHNINAGFKVDQVHTSSWNIKAVLEIIMSDGELADQQLETPELSISRARERIRNSVAGFMPNTTDEQPDFTPMSEVTEVLA